LATPCYQVSCYDFNCSSNFLNIEAISSLNPNVSFIKASTDSTLGYDNQVPTLTSTPENWAYQEYAPIPVGYFVQLFDPNFWAYYAPK
jgi:hypothetical protein